MFGPIDNPFQNLAPGTGLATSSSGSGAILLISLLVQVSVVFAGIYTVINFILAGYGLLSAGGDAKLVQKSWERIWRSVLGLIIVASAVLIAMMVGWFVFGDTGALVNPRIYAP